MWTIGAIRIFVQEKQHKGSQDIARLQPVKGPTVLQVFGYELPIYTIVGKVVGETDEAALRNLTKSGVGFELNGHGTDYGDFLVKDVKTSQNDTIWQSLRTDLDCTAPVFDFEMELYKTR